ncbi:MAG: HlyD family efflux transporter periplasmic adaptor subunit [Pirellulales bacterium]|nr:HlyD family efflux transporter periplasmic adaptor subunit [Pirellulales bacterium]
MSTESSLDPQLIEQTKQQIRSLVSEIAQLSKEDLTPEEFYGQFLTRVVSALAAVGGAVWTVNEDRRLALQYQINIQETKLRDNEEGQIQHSRLLYNALQTPEGMLVPPHAGSGDDSQAANPTDFLLVLGPLKTDLETVGVLEIFQRSEAGPNTQKGYLRFMMQMCELAADFLKSHQLRHFSDRQVLWTQLEEFTHVVHAALDPRETAYTIANEGRRLIECDRVSVAIRKGTKCRIEAVSGQDLFDKRSNTIRLLGKLASAVVATGDPIWYAGDTRDMAPQVEDAIQEYVDESHSKNVAVLPLKRPEQGEEDDPKKRDSPEPPIGALIVEQIEDSRVPQSMVQRVEVVCRHSSTALANALEHQSLFLMPVWRTLGKAKWVLRARTLPKTLTITGLVLASLVALAVWPADFKIQAKGTLEPVIRNDVFARIEGVVEDVRVEHGDVVYTTDVADQVEGVLRKQFVTSPAVLVDADVLHVIRQTMLAAGIDAQTARKTVEAIRIRHGGRDVSAGELIESVRQNMNVLLVQLRPTTELKVAIEDLEGRRDATTKEINKDLQLLGSGGTLTRDKRAEVSGDIAKLRVELANYEEQLELYDRQLEDLKVTSPINGQVVTWDLYDRLNRRPVQRGQVLLRVADPSGPWRVELQMADDRMGHIRMAQQAMYDQLRDKLREVTRKRQADEPELDVEAAVEKVTDRQLVPKLRELLADELLPDLRNAIGEILERDQPALPAVDETPAAEGTAETTTASPEETVDPPPQESAVETSGKSLLTAELRFTLQGVVDAIDAGSCSYEQARARVQRLMVGLPDGELRQGLRDALDDGLDDRLPVTYILAIDPSNKLPGKVEEIHLNAEVRGDEGNTVLIKVAIDKEQLPDLRPGATVTANVYCGRRPIGYVWFHDLIAFVQSRILFRYF